MEKKGGVLQQQIGCPRRLKTLLLQLIIVPDLVLLFVCIVKSCDLAERTLCLLSIQSSSKKREGWMEREEEKIKITLLQSQPIPHHTLINSWSKKYL